jgi:hypothetical protein
VGQELLEFLIGIRRKEKTVKQTTQSGMAPHCIRLENGKARRFPACMTVSHGFGVGKAFPGILVRKTCGTFFIWSGTIENQFLIFGKIGNHGLKLSKTDRVFQSIRPELLITDISTDKQRIS